MEGCNIKIYLALRNLHCNYFGKHLEKYPWVHNSQFFVLFYKKDFLGKYECDLRQPCFYRFFGFSQDICLFLEKFFKCTYTPLRINITSVKVNITDCKANKKINGIATITCITFYIKINVFIIGCNKKKITKIFTFILAIYVTMTVFNTYINNIFSILLTYKNISIVNENGVTDRNSVTYLLALISILVFFFNKCQRKRRPIYIMKRKKTWIIFSSIKNTKPKLLY